MQAKISKPHKQSCYNHAYARKVMFHLMHSRHFIALHGLPFWISSKDSYICSIPQTGHYIPWSVLWSTGWNAKTDTQKPICFSCWGVVKHSFIRNAKQLNESIMRDRPDNPWHQSRHYEGATSDCLCLTRLDVQVLLNPAVWNRCQKTASFHGRTCQSWLPGHGYLGWSRY